MKEIKDLNVYKASQASIKPEIPAKIIKENADAFFSFIYQSFNNLIDVCIFTTSLKLANIALVFKKGPKIQKQPSCKIYQKFAKGVYLNKCKITFKISF